MVFLNELAADATKSNTSIVLFYGNDDMLIRTFWSYLKATNLRLLILFISVAHTGGEVVIQNTTFGGIQGFTVKPGTPWYDDAGEFAGIVHQERGWKYALVKGAGHMVAYYNPTSVRSLAVSIRMNIPHLTFRWFPCRPTSLLETSSLARTPLDS
jgi:carboxypeptidase D